MATVRNTAASAARILSPAGNRYRWRSATSAAWASSWAWKTDADAWAGGKRAKRAAYRIRAAHTARPRRRWALLAAATSLVEQKGHDVEHGLIAAQHAATDPITPGDTEAGHCTYRKCLHQAH